MRRIGALAGRVEAGILGAARGQRMRDALAENRGRIIVICGLLVAANVAAWVWALVAFRHHPALFGTALLAYSFGARHALDADHIAAIDNVTRKLMQDGKRPLGVGLYFSLGHSTIVVALTVAIALGAGAVKAHLPGLQQAGELIGTSISATFLFLVAAINLVVLLDIVRAFDSARRQKSYDDAGIDDMLNRRGLIGRFFRPLIKIVDASWKMYP